ncbi:hypothetical protein IWQ60_008862 [Tieghemiomyces parasiticus]|uniref:Uncharacterized protein n=1 Tax=Tieghemiomyces parasiticus TaxID=78921 RepID=A0A9W7ZQA1_9FUNG|nr:hypothetical protein IWQ60_008862 [Tieghemiomyces parasiticus]
MKFTLCSFTLALGAYTSAAMSINPQRVGYYPSAAIPGFYSANPDVRIQTVDPALLTPPSALPFPPSSDGGYPVPDMTGTPYTYLANGGSSLAANPVIQPGADNQSTLMTPADPLAVPFTEMELLNLFETSLLMTTNMDPEIQAQAALSTLFNLESTARSAIFQKMKNRNFNFDPWKPRQPLTAHADIGPHAPSTPNDLVRPVYLVMNGLSDVDQTKVFPYYALINNGRIDLLVQLAKYLEYGTNRGLLLAALKRAFPLNNQPENYDSVANAELGPRSGLAKNFFVPWAILTLAQTDNPRAPLEFIKSVAGTDPFKPYTPTYYALAYLALYNNGRTGDAAELRPHLPKWTLAELYRCAVEYNMVNASVQLAREIRSNGSPVGSETKCPSPLYDKVYLRFTKDNNLLLLVQEPVALHQLANLNGKRLVPTSTYY